jgi:ATP-dependent protease ClpP protease subunit
MSLLNLPNVRADFRLGSAQFDLRADALARWDPELRAAADDKADTISIYDAIGADAWTGEGITAKRIGGILRNMGGKDVTVNINSPGGDFFEGIAIYNLLREHQGKVTVKVMGLAASAASVIAMAGDEILMGDGSFLMIHNAWTVAMGNRHDLAEASASLAPFDAAMADLYSARTGMSNAEAVAMMDKETWLGASAAVDVGFATALMNPDEVKKDESVTSGKKALALIDGAMAKAGYSRSLRREALKSLFDGKPGAADEAKPGAGDEAAIMSLIQSLKG